MAKFEKLQAPIYVSAYRPAVDAAPPWAPKKMPKKMNDDDWLVQEGKKISVVSNADMNTKYKFVNLTRKFPGEALAG